MEVCLVARFWDIAFRVLETVNSVNRTAMQDAPDDDFENETQIYICDINPNMLNVGKKRAAQRGLGKDRALMWVEGDAEALSFQDCSMDGYTIGFGIRNVTHIEKALAEAYRYDYYSFSIIPAVGELVAGDRDSYQYLVESIRRFPSQETFAGMIADAGFQKVEYENLAGGVEIVLPLIEQMSALKELATERHTPKKASLPRRLKGLSIVGAKKGVRYLLLTKVLSHEKGLCNNWQRVMFSYYR
ncbi:2-hexaprenyl-6-methoxy-1,4-benzoquinone methyltransferase [Asimina triloba]